MWASWASRGYIGAPFSPGPWLEPGLKVGHLSRVKPRPGTKDPGACPTPFCPGSWLDPGLKVPNGPGLKAAQPRTATGPYDPGLMPPLVPGCNWPGIIARFWAERKPLFLLVLSSDDIERRVFTTGNRGLGGTGVYENTPAL